jgi:hypothetical protein
MGDGASCRIALAPSLQFLVEKLYNHSIRGASGKVLPLGTNQLRQYNQWLVIYYGELAPFLQPFHLQCHGRGLVLFKYVFATPSLRLVCWFMKRLNLRFFGNVLITKTGT